MLFVEFKAEDDECYCEDERVRTLQYNIIAEFTDMNIKIGYNKESYRQRSNKTR